MSEKQLDINKYNSENLNIRSTLEGYKNSSKESESGEDGWQVVRRKKRPKEKRIMPQLLTRNILGTLVIHGICKKSDSLCTLKNFGLLYISHKISRQTGRSKKLSYPDLTEYYSGGAAAAHHSSFC